MTCVYRLTYILFMVLADIMHMHGQNLSHQVDSWHIKVHGYAFGQKVVNWVFSTLIGKPSQFVITLLTLNTRIVKKQSLPLSLIQLLYTCDL